MKKVERNSDFYVIVLTGFKYDTNQGNPESIKLKLLQSELILVLPYSKWYSWSSLLDSLSDSMIQDSVFSKAYISF